MSGVGRPALRVWAESPPFPRLRAAPQTGTHGPRPQLSLGGEAGVRPRTSLGWLSRCQSLCCPLRSFAGLVRKQREPGELGRAKPVLVRFRRTPSLYPGLSHRKYFSFEERVFLFFFDFPPAFSLSLFAKFACKPAMIKRRAPLRRRDAAASAPASLPRASRRPNTARDTPGTAPGWDGTGGTRTC